MMPYLRSFRKPCKSKYFGLFQILDSCSMTCTSVQARDGICGIYPSSHDGTSRSS
ncbi:hypothetical protein Mapa_009292 [Marchantia paleacea]|nr:hypothetical protein Mapa_009292 [Marchantia paleacea]